MVFSDCLKPTKFVTPTNKILCHPSDPTDFFATQILGGHMTSRNQGLSSNDQGRREERPWERGWRLLGQPGSLALRLVQSLNSPFFPPHIGAEPGRAKEESRITCMRMLRTPPFFPPQSGEKPYLEVLSRFGLWRDFLNENIQATISAFRLIKNMSINPRSVEFHQCHAKPHSICFS